MNTPKYDAKPKRARSLSGSRREPYEGPPSSGRPENARHGLPRAQTHHNRIDGITGDSFGVDGYIRYMPAAYGISIRAHGAPANTAHYSASGVAKIIGEFMNKNDIDKTKVKNIYLQSCYSRTGGIFSQAAALANITGLKTFSVNGKYSRQRENEMQVSEPSRFEVIRSISAKGNKAMFRVVRPGVSLIRWARGRSST